MAHISLRTLLSGNVFVGTVPHHQRNTDYYLNKGTRILQHDYIFRDVFIAYCFLREP